MNPKQLYQASMHCLSSKGSYRDMNGVYRDRKILSPQMIQSKEHPLFSSGDSFGQLPDFARACVASA